MVRRAVVTRGGVIGRYTGLYHPGAGEDGGPAPVSHSLNSNPLAREPGTMATSTYEITFKGEAGKRLRAAFEGLDISADHGVTVLKGEVLDQAALHGIIDRVQALGLELVDVRIVVDE